MDFYSGLIYRYISCFSQLGSLFSNPLLFLLLQCFDYDSLIFQGNGISYRILPCSICNSSHGWLVSTLEGVTWWPRQQNYEAPTGQWLATDRCREYFLLAPEFNDNHANFLKGIWQCNFSYQSILNQLRVFIIACVMGNILLVHVTYAFECQFGGARFPYERERCSPLKWTNDFVYTKISQWIPVVLSVYLSDRLPDFLFLPEQLLYLWWFVVSSGIYRYLDEALHPCERTGAIKRERAAWPDRHIKRNEASPCWFCPVEQSAWYTTVHTINRAAKGHSRLNLGAAIRLLSPIYNTVGNNAVVRTLHPLSCEVGAECTCCYRTLYASQTVYVSWIF